MNVTEQIEILKFEARLANRASGQGIRNWTPEARAASLATRRANGSVWGWNKRKRAMPSTSQAFDRSIEAMTEDAETVRSALASQRAGVPTIGARSKYADQLSGQRLEEFKSWLAELRRTDDAIADFNEIVAVMGGMTSGIAKAQRGQTIGPDYGTPAAESAARKASSIEKSIRRNFEKRNNSYLRSNPDERDIMMDMVAEKAEYYSASPARKVEMEKAAYRQIRDNGSVTMRKAPAPGVSSAEMEAAARERARNNPDFLALSKSIRRAMEKQGASYLKKSPEAWDAFSEMVAEKAEYYAATPAERARMDKAAYRLIRDSGLLYNRAHSAKCASSTGSECNCSCGGSLHGGGTGTKLTAVTDDGTHKSAGGTRADGTPFFVGVGEDIGDGTTVVNVDVKNEKIRVKDKDGNEYDISMKSGEAVEVEPDPDGKVKAGDNGPTDEEGLRSRIVAAFGEEMRDEIDKNEALSDAIDAYDEHGSFGMSEDERRLTLESMSNNETPSPEMERLRAELESASEVYTEVREKLSEMVSDSAVSLQDCFDQLKADGDMELYRVKVDALSDIYGDATSKAVIAKYGDKPVSEEQFNAIQAEIGIPPDMFGEYNPEVYDPDSTLQNRHTSACATSKGDECDCSCGGKSHGVPSSSKSSGGDDEPLKEKPVREADANTDYGKKLKEKGINLEGKKTLDTGRFSEKYKRDVKTPEDRVEAERLNAEAGNAPYVIPSGIPYDVQDADISLGKNGARGMTEEERLVLIDYYRNKKNKDKQETRDLPLMEKASEEWGKLVTGFGKMIAGGARPTETNLKAQLKIDKDRGKYRMAIDALAEAYHTTSLDKFQDKFDRDPKNNYEFRMFQKSVNVPVQYIGSGETK